VPPRPQAGALNKLAKLDKFDLADYLADDWGAVRDEQR